MLDKINWASEKKVAETFAVMETDKTNPLVSSVVKEQNMVAMFHKIGDQVVMGPYRRECILQADVNTVLQKLFLASNFLCFAMGQVGCVVAYDERGIKYELEKGGKDSFVQNSFATTIVEGSEWFKRVGSSKNYAPRFSPLPFNVFKGEDQYIFLQDGVLTVVCISGCIFNGPNLRTIRHFVITPTSEGTSQVVMYFGGLFTDIQDPAVIARQAAGVRAQTFGECSSTPDCTKWSFQEHASTFLQNF